MANKRLQWFLEKIILFQNINLGFENIKAQLIRFLDFRKKLRNK